MPTHVAFFRYKINQKIVIVFRFVIKIIVQNVQITKRNESTQIEDGWRNAVDEPKIQHVCPYWRPPSSLALFLSSSLSLSSVSLFLSFSLPFPHDATPLQSDCGEASPPYWPSFVGKLPLTDVCIVEPTTLLFGWVRIHERTDDTYDISRLFPFVNYRAYIRHESKITVRLLWSCRHAHRWLTFNRKDRVITLDPSMEFYGRNRGERP